MRAAAAVVAVVLGGVCLLVADVTRYADETIFESRAFADRATSILDDPGVEAEISTQITKQALELRPNLIAIKPVIETTADQIVAHRSSSS
jgi:hypothetical protein